MRMDRSQFRKLFNLTEIYKFQVRKKWEKKTVQTLKVGNDKLKEKL